MPPTETETQFRLVGLTDALPPLEDTPVPVSATVCGLPVPESVKLSVADRDPLAVGLNTTDAEQLAAAARLDPHDLLEMLKSPPLLPLIAMLLMLIEELVPFDNVIATAALLDPIFTLPKEWLVGLTDTVPDPGAP
jgi:hypothetical protein